eukprot:Nk52_evm20s2367 gene=Nk52_evmTU20s2367
MTSFNEKFLLSTELCEILKIEDEVPITIPEVIKLMWNVIKRKNLQKEDDKRVIVWDEELEHVFGEKQSICFDLHRLILSHSVKYEKFTLSDPMKRLLSDYDGSPITTLEFKKMLYSEISERKLLNPANENEILCDDDFVRVFGVRSILNAYELDVLCQGHLHPYDM